MNNITYDLDHLLELADKCGHFDETYFMYNQAKIWYDEIMFGNDKQSKQIMTKRGITRQEYALDVAYDDLYYSTGMQEVINDTNIQY